MASASRQDKGAWRTDELTKKPYATWLESVVRDLVDIDPVSISMQMRDAEGKVYTCYYNCSHDDRAVMEDALRQDGLFEWVRDNKEAIVEILNEEDDADGIQETDSEADSP